MAADRLTKRMHSVPRSYFQAFAADDPRRREAAGIWRFERYTGRRKLIGINDSEVVNDLYTVCKGGMPDVGIENILAKMEEDFTAARNVLLDRQSILQRRLPLTKEQWAGIAKFIAAQL